MNILELIQGSPAWQVARAQHFCASEAPAVFGTSKYMTRSELLRQKHAGITPDVDSATQRRFDSGHTAEAAARPIVEKRLGVDLYPVTGTLEVDGLSLLASFDGLTITDELVWETKLLNSDLLRQVQAEELEPHYYWQLEHQLLVSGAEKVYFTTSDGSEEGTHGFYYESKPERRAALIAGWKQFAEDLRNYEPSAVEIKPTGKPPETLPALLVEISGAVKATNLPEFKEIAIARFKAINRDLITDEDFADAEQTVKWCADVEDRLKAAKQHALSQTASIDELFRAIDDISAEARRARLDLDKLVTSRKQEIRDEIVSDGSTALAAHIAGLNKSIGKDYMPQITADFGGSIKGKRNLAAMRDAVATTLANAKIDADAKFKTIMENMAWLREHTKDYSGLFADTKQLVLKAHDDFVAVAQSRITTEQQRVQAEHDRIREEGAARERQRLIDEGNARKAKQQTAAAPAPVAVPSAVAPVAKPVITIDGPFTSDVPVPKFDTGARIKLGQINERIAPLSIKADGLAELGFQHVATDKAAKLYRESDFSLICDALIQHLTQSADLQAT